MLQVALNGPGSHPRMPRTPDETAADAAASVAAGADAIHLHAFDDDGRETLEGHHVAATLAAVRRRCPGVPVNMTTFAEIEPDPARRLALVSGWTLLPDLVPANQGEAGVDELTELLAGRGVGVEACVLGVEDAERMAARGRWSRYERVFVEPTDLDATAAVASAAAMEAVLLGAGCSLDQVHHGVGPATWDVLARAVTRGHGIRVGLEDTDVLPDGSTARDNADLVRAAAALAVRTGGRAGRPPR